MKLTFQKSLCPLWQMVSSSFHPTEGPYFSYSVPLIMQHTHTRSAVRGYKECRPQKYLSFRGISFALASHGEICGTVLCTQSCLTLCDPMDCNPPGSFVHRDSPGKNTGVGCHVLLQGNLPNPGTKNRGLLHCRQILYCLSHHGSPALIYITFILGT